MVLFDLGRDLAPSWTPLVLAVILLILLALLWFSMRRHLRKAARYSHEQGVDIHAPRIDEPTR